jgi:hypothetical protein
VMTDCAIQVNVINNEAMKMRVSLRLSLGADFRPRRIRMGVMTKIASARIPAEVNQVKTCLVNCKGSYTY